MFWWLILEVFKEIIANRRKLYKFFKETKYLNYNPLFLCRAYEDELTLDESIPYKEEISFVCDTWEETKAKSNSIKIKGDGNFSLGHDRDELSVFQCEALISLKKSKRVKYSSQIVRLRGIDRKTNSLIIQKAEYYDQAKSNLVMDWDENHELKRKLNIPTLRTYLSGGSRTLMLLSDDRMANTIGIAAIIYYMNPSGDIVPYLPRRTKGKTAVFHGKYHCTTSAAVEWSESSNFDEIFTNDMYVELEDEVGIERNEVREMIPIAICREFLRGGKHQIFFVGYTTLTEKEIVKKRKEAIRKQTGMASEVRIREVKNAHLSFKDEKTISKHIKKRGLTLEAVANLYYAEKVIQQYKEYCETVGFPL